MNTLGVSLVHYACPICGKEADDGIIMNSMLTEENAKSIEKLNGKTVGYADHVCKECAKYKDSVVYFIGINSELSTDDIYRTGQVVGVDKKAKFMEQFKDYIRTIDDGTEYILIDEKAGKELNIFE